MNAAIAVLIACGVCNTLLLDVRENPVAFRIVASVHVGALLALLASCAG